MKIIRLLFFIVLMALGASIGLLNGQTVTFHYFLGEQTLPLSILLFSAFFIGVFLSLIAGLFKTFSLKQQIWSLKRECAKHAVAPEGKRVIKPTE